MKRLYLKAGDPPGHLPRLALLLFFALLISGCSVWNPWGYKKDWPAWKKTAFFLGPGHCPVCYCVGGAVLAVTYHPLDDEKDAVGSSATTCVDGTAVATDEPGVAVPDGGTAPEKPHESEEPGDSPEAKKGTAE